MTIEEAIDSLPADVLKEFCRTAGIALMDLRRLPLPPLNPARPEHLGGQK